MPDHGQYLKDMEASGWVPKPVAQSILKRTEEESVVRRVAGTTPVPLEGTAVGFQTGSIEAGVVGEGQLKPVGSLGQRQKSITPIKVAAVAWWTKELRMKNPVRVLDRIEESMAGAISRALDAAVLYADNPVTGKIIGKECVNDTPHRVALGTSSKADGGLSTDLMAGYDLVEENYHYGEFSSFTADPRLRSRLRGATDLQGRPIFAGGGDNTGSLTANLGTILDLPAAYGKAVSNRGAAGLVPTNVLAFGGDFRNAVQYGFTENMTMRKTDVGIIQDGDTTVNLFQQNAEAVLVEAIFGWIITDVNAFVAYTGDSVVRPWSATTAYREGATVSNGGQTLQAVSFDGTTGASAPASVDAVGGTVEDGTVTWRRIG